MMTRAEWERFDDNMQTLDGNVCKHEDIDAANDSIAYNQDGANDDNATNDDITMTTALTMWTPVTIRSDTDTYGC